jgi:nucleoside-diphosphate-sugar epimerase
MGKALVLGASGHIGNAVLRELLSHGWDVTAARRGRSAAHNLVGLQVTEALGDGNDAATLDRWIAGHDLVIDAAAPYPISLADVGAVEVSAQRATALADAITRHHAHLVHVGSFVTRLGARDLPTRQTNRRLDDVHPYFAAKRAGEQAFAHAAMSGAPITIVHPTYCMGPWDTRPTALSLVPRLLAGEVPAVPSHIINVIDVRDVARGVVAAADKGPCREPILFSGHNVALPELCALICELAAVQVTTRSLPPAAAQVGAWALELGMGGTDVPGALLWTALLLRHSPLTVDATQRALGAVPRPLSITLRETIAWYREHPQHAGPNAPAATNGQGSASAERPRVRRPEPARTAPRRNAAGAIGLGNSVPAAQSRANGHATNGHATNGRSNTTATRPRPYDDDPVSRAVDAGYDVIERALRRRTSDEARSPLASMPWAAPWLSVPFGDLSSGSWTVGRLVDAMMGTFAQWAQGPGAAAWQGTSSPMTAAWQAASQMAPAWPAASPIAPPTRGAAHDPMNVNVDLELRSPRAVAVQLRLSPGAGPALRVDALVAHAEPTAAPITDVSIACADGRVRIALGSLEHHPPGTYQGAVFSAGRACGELVVRLA